MAPFVYICIKTDRLYSEMGAVVESCRGRTKHSEENKKKSEKRHHQFGICPRRIVFSSTTHSLDVAATSDIPVISAMLQFVKNLLKSCNVVAISHAPNGDYITDKMSLFLSVL